MEQDKQKLLDNVWIRFIFFAGLVVLFFLICNFLKGILISLFLAFTIAYIFDPVVDFIETRKKIFPRIRIPRSCAIGILLLSGTLFSGCMLTYAIPKTVDGIQQVGSMLRVRFPNLRSNVGSLIERYGNKEVAAFLNSQLGIDNDIEKEAAHVLSDTKNISATHVLSDTENISNDAEIKEGRLKTLVNIKKYSPQMFKIASDIGKEVFKSTFGILGIVVNFFVFGVVTIYLLRDFDNITGKITGLIPFSRRDKASEILSKIDVSLKGFFRGQVLVCVILSFIYSIGLTIVGVPLAFVLGFLAGFGNVIPYVGTIVGLALTMVITFFQFQDIQHLAFVGMVFGFGQLLEGTVITPKIIGDKLGLNPVIIIISILIWSQLLGFLGLLLAVPITAAAKVLIDDGVIRYKESPFYKKLIK